MNLTYFHPKMRGNVRLQQGPSLWGDGGDMSPQLLDRVGHNIFCPPNIL